MKELFLTGTVVAALTLFGASPAGIESETNRLNPAQTLGSEGFVPHERVTAPPVYENGRTDDPLPDYGSEAYL